MAEQSLFGTTPEALMASRDAALRQQAAQYAQLDPFQQATMGIYQGASKLGGVVGGMLGGQDPEMQRASMLKQLASQFDTTTAEGLTGFARAASQAGMPQQAMQAAQQAQAMRLEQTKIGKTQAELNALNLSAQQKTDYRDAMAKLGPTPSQEAIIGTAVQFGEVGDVLKVVQGAADKEAARAQALELAKQANEARVEAARQRGEDQKAIARMQLDGRAQMAQLAAALKGPSAAVIKAQERADKIAEGQEGLAGTVETAKTLVNDLAKKGGMTTTSATPLANLVTSLGTGTIGQAGGRLFGTETQSKRDELNSVRLQLFNAVKEATGMSSTQLNSNVELQTWLKSLGSDTMTKEANLAILNNISNRYLKKGSTKGEMTTSFNSVAEAEAAKLPKGTRITINGRQAEVQ